MSATDTILVLAVAGIAIGVVATAVRHGVALPSDPQDLMYWLSSEEDDLEVGEELDK
jgi:hypothetical protein